MSDFSKQSWEEKANGVKKLSRVLNNMPLNLSDALVYLMGTYNVSVNELSKSSGVGVTTIKHIRGHVKTDCSFNIAVRLCVGNIINFEFIKRTSRCFTYSEEHFHYKENEYIVTSQQGLLQRNSNYLFVKRFTAKEEHRRLQCGVYIAKKYKEYNTISTQNKIN